LVISALAGSGRGSDVVSVRVDDIGEPRNGELKVKGSLLRTLTIAGHPPACTAQLVCRADLELKEWLLKFGTLPEEEVPHMRLIPWYRLAEAGRLENFFDRIGGLDNVFLPFMRKENEPDQHSVIYLFDGSAFTLESREVRPAAVVVPEGAASRQIFLRRVRNGYELKVPSPSEPDTGPIAGQQQAAEPPAPRSQLHVVLDPWEVRGRPPGLVAQGLKRVLEENGFRAIVSAGGQEIPPESRQLEVLGSKLLVWSGELRDGWSVRLEGLPRPLGEAPVGSASQNSVPEGRIAANHWIARIPVIVPPGMLSNSWQVSIKAVNRIYGSNQPAQSNELCEFKLVSRANDSRNVVSQLTKEGDVLRSTARVDTSNLVDARLEIEVIPSGGAAPCVQQSVALAPLSWQMINNVPTASGAVTLTPRGRWFLALYAPQGIGGGIPVEASAQSVFEARSQIVDSMMIWLELSRKRYFADVDPSKAALGFDLALVGAADVPATAPFEEANVIVGQYRQPKTTQFKIDSMGERRLEAFFRGPRAVGGAPSFEALERMILRYARLFGPLDPEGSAPIVVYVGAGTPNPDSCRDWAQMTANVKPIRLLALAFVSASAAAIRQSLGNSGAVPENTATRPLGYSCKGENESALLLVPFPDLIARAPDLVLQGIFEKLDLWMATRN
jgi:hypothetical protein